MSVPSWIGGGERPRCEAQLLEGGQCLRDGERKVRGNWLCAAHLPRPHWTRRFGFPRRQAYRLLVAAGWEPTAQDQRRVTEWGAPHPTIRSFSTAGALWRTATCRHKRLAL